MENNHLALGEKKQSSYMFTCTWIKLPVCCGLIFPFLLSLSHKRVYTKQRKTTLEKKKIGKIIVCSYGKGSQMWAKF